MENDRLKEFVDHHRHEFDDLEKINYDQVWSMLNPKESNSSWVKSLIIGLFVILLTMIWMLWMNHKKTNQQLNSLEQFVMDSPQYKSKHEDLMVFVHEKEKRVKNAQIETSEYEEIFKELKELELLRLDMEQDFDQYGNHEKLMKTLFKHYERKAKILELLLFENEKKKYNEDIHRSRTY